MEEKRICPKCTGTMLKGIHEDCKTVFEPMGSGKVVDIYKYVCLSCGFVEEYADIEKFNKE
ncbi:hypothetical protein [Clostridium botulinum]|uniref:Uncharacterized protein n=1 Tax=Clostridium botulinum (strain Langeland / NCTC 10281 / Type F) TaxID=441772 RepID=A7GEF7_CLOBL|nr:hypothetical protein [Clostridium botulinum]ABS42772.1 hypothetical protein CLI_1909 [Clostridium botulinum F str. Langeland]ADF99585.1 hypothetical protein CBF_1890 [Clostridium botulinum F str. 230613]KKM42837.1 hypothetical protein VT72_04140 [Clostridium botulinum]MBY6791643.1 hypothetical protein [Clostridium botulinum]MBY6936879.1 hypothetical protein [Clostridium botulinum]